MWRQKNRGYRVLEMFLTEQKIFIIIMPLRLTTEKVLYWVPNTGDNAVGIGSASK